MEYEDRITIWAPEGLALEYTLAGLGSRFIAEFFDVLVRVAVLGALIAVLALAGAGQTALLITLVVGSFLALFAYDIAFEVWAAGRTPGKRWCSLRVLTESGRQVSFATSAVRNLMRIVDIWATAMIAGIVSIVLTKRSQRLGDLAAGTLVIREHRGARPATTATLASAINAAIDVTAVTASELSAIRDFLERRETLTAASRARVAQALADAVGGKVGGLPPNGLPPERLLEAVTTAKRAPRYGSAPPT